MEIIDIENLNEVEVIQKKTNKKIILFTGMDASMISSQITKSRLLNNTFEDVIILNFNDDVNKDMNNSHELFAPKLNLYMPEPLPQVLQITTSNKPSHNRLRVKWQIKNTTNSVNKSRVKNKMAKQSRKKNRKKK